MPFPNKDTQFKEGKSGNLNGRPNGSKSFNTRIKELLSGMSDDKEWTSPLAAEKIIIIFSKHKEGEHVGEYVYPTNERQKAIDSILNRAEGMPTQGIDIKTDKPIVSIHANMTAEEAHKIYIDMIKDGK